MTKKDKGKIIAPKYFTLYLKRKQNNCLLIFRLKIQIVFYQYYERELIKQRSLETNIIFKDSRAT